MPKYNSGLDYNSTIFRDQPKKEESNMKEIEPDFEYAMTDININISDEDLYISKGDSMSFDPEYGDTVIDVIIKIAISLMCDENVITTNYDPYDDIKELLSKMIRIYNNFTDDDLSNVIKSIITKYGLDNDHYDNYFETIYDLLQEIRNEY